VKSVEAEQMNKNDPNRDASSKRPDVEAAFEILGEPTARRLGIYPIPDELVLSVVIPIYNEKDTLAEIIRRVRAVPIRKQMILVDDGSGDGTREILKELEADDDLEIVYQPFNQGKGAALRAGFARATGDIVLIQDADLEYDPNQYAYLIQPIVEGSADVVYGSRFLFGGAHRVLYFWHYVANRMLTTLSNMFTDLNLTDMETCYKIFRREALESFRDTLKQNRFGIEPEMTAKVARRGWRIYELGISYDGRTYQAGKKIGFRDALQALWCIVRYWWKD
jgi:glycosyltransferase involved in cell wall biosynthesis